ncbi:MULTISPECIES: hypothetical protein [Mesorhizobium]|uniref:hypothetical protein n=1 Tax=Mesorhizobium TaxID=68287 RepID=UPI000FCBDDCF|nr:MULTISPECIES: hypothetical protein [Mesorhizobium]MDF3208365.1 hypothetical protein [Mesorhizobium sp. LMG15046]MDF3229063.1 hypothetical protein [Mesorhizobium sp. DSM 30133]RUU22176.1 hypothetical protein EOC84_03430 [Mesorhizobium sp. Primo-B]RUU37914.1 hypothetical protein EOC83_16785 [Mesorhizobium sp. Primo-A]RVB69353.1 hypothetical protein EN895_00860 [Mesorhizobium sp. M7A.F.Ca.CA.002.03.2.1]
MYHWRVGRLGGSIYVAKRFQPVGAAADARRAHEAYWTARNADMLEARAYLASLQTMTANDW